MASGWLQDDFRRITSEDDFSMTQSTQIIHRDRTLGKHSESTLRALKEKLVREQSDFVIPLEPKILRLVLTGG